MSFGSNKQRTSSVQEQSSTGRSWQSGGGSSSSTDYGTNVWKPQQNFLTDLWGRARSATSNFQNEGMETMQQGRQALMGMLNPGIDPAFGAYAQNLGQQFREQILPGLQQNAIGAGQLGGSRHQLGNALASQRAMQSLGDFAAQTYAGQQDRILQATNQLGAVADFERQMPFYALSQYAGLLGGPVMQDLGGKSSSSQYSSGGSVNESSGTSTSTGKASGFNFGAPAKWFGG